MDDETYVLLSDNPRFRDISIVPIDDVMIENVAEHCKVSVSRVQSYLASKDDQDDELLRGFLFYGVGPVGKVFIEARHEDTLEKAPDVGVLTMGCIVPAKVPR